MAKKPGDKKIGSIKSSVVKPTETAGEVTGAEAVSDVSEVQKVKATSGVTGARGPSGVGGRRRPTKVMSMADRDELFKMVTEEADKLFAGTKISDERKKVIADAVKMAMDTGILPEQEKKK